MGMTERGPNVSDKVSAQLVECVPETPEGETPPPVDATPPTTVDTTEPVGADPPPE